MNWPESAALGPIVADELQRHRTEFHGDGQTVRAKGERNKFIRP